MPKIPGSESLGSPNVPRGTRPVISGADYGAGMVGRGIEKVGATVSAIGEEERQREDALDLIKADNDLQEGLRATRREFETDPDYKTYGPRFDEKVAPLTEAAAAKIRNPNTRAKFMERARGQAISSRESVLSRGLSLEREHKEIEVENELSRSQGSYAATRDPVERQRILQGMLEKATLAERTGLVRPKAAERYRDQFVDGTIALDIEERLYDDPEGVLRDLGMVPGGRKPASVTTGSPLKIENQGEHSVIHGGGGAKFRVASTYAGRFAGFIADLEAAGVDVKGDQSGGYAKRNIRGTNTPSKHSHGEAIDINWHENAEGKPGSLSERLGDDKVRELARKHGLKWGADFKGRSRDDMHFEIDKDAVIRRDLPAPVGASPEEDPAPDVLPFGDPDAPPSAEEMASPTRSQYAMLSGRRRQVMINKARIALSHTYQRRLADDNARIEDGGEEERDERGETAFDKASRILQPNVLAQWKTKRDKAILKRDSLRAMENMPEDQMEDHIAGIGRERQTVRDPLTGEQRQVLGEERTDIGYAEIKAVRDQADAKRDKILAKRRSDPFSAVAQAPEVQNAIAAMRYGSPSVVVGTAEVMPADGGDPSLPGVIREDATPQQQRAAAIRIVEASLEAQKKLGISDPRHISKDGAKRLLAISKTGGKEGLRDGLEAAAKRAGDLYGAEMGEKVFKDAIVLTLGTGGFDENADAGSLPFIQAKQAEARAETLAKSIFGRPITDADMERLNRQDQWLRVIGQGPDFSGRSGGFDQGRPAIGQPLPQQSRQPSEGHIKLLMQQMAADPVKAREIFDSKFGEGAARRAVNRIIEGEMESP